MRGFRTVLEQKIKERRLTLEEFAEFAEMFAREHDEPGTLGARHLQRLASGRGPNGKPLGPVRPATARLLERIFGVDIDVLLGAPTEAVERTGQGTEPDFGAVFDWLDERAGWAMDTSRRQVTSRLGKLDAGELRDRQVRHARTGRSEIARVLWAYYGEAAAGDQAYAVRCGGAEVLTSVLTRVEWLDLGCSLTPDSERLELDYAVTFNGDVGPDQAVRRLAEAAVLDVRVANAPVYRLVDVDLGPGRIGGTVGLASFVEYALSMDLLEDELVDMIAANALAAMPLRDRYLPDLVSVVELSERLCAGGVVALCAVARESGDYALLVQERSGQVLNAARRLSVIPKGFHQPLAEPRADAQISATLLRKLEGELFGRAEVDLTTAERRAAAPMHPGRLSEPMRWLIAEPDRMRLECTGFGLNLVSGNYEFAGLVVIDDPEFWTQFGGEIEANWEASGMRLYSSMDSELLAHLIRDESWSNEGLFALLQGLRRLHELGKVDLPGLELISSRTASGR